MRLKASHHHSLSDWDFPSASWQLTTLHYISSPTGIRVHTAHSPAFSWIFLKSSLAGCVREGRIISWLYHQGLSDLQPRWCFRAQAVPTGQGATSHMPDDCYMVTIDNSGVATRITIDSRVAGANTTLYEGDSADWPASEDNWVKWRITWYEYISDTFEAYLRIVVEYWDGSAWQEATHYDDGNNRWSASAVNLVGFTGYGLFVDDDWYNVVDDTEIWIKA